MHVLFTEIAPQMGERPGGYTRITKIGPHKATTRRWPSFEIVQEAYKPAEKKPAKKAAPAPKAEEKPTEELSGEIVEEDTEANVGEEVSEQSVAEAAEESLSAKFADLELGDDVAVALEDGAAPSDAFTIKGNKDSGKYHTPDSQWYDQTIAEVWFTTEEAAENPASSRPADQPEACCWARHPSGWRAQFCSTSRWASASPRPARRSVSTYVAAAACTSLPAAAAPDRTKVPRRPSVTTTPSASSSR